MPKGEVKTERLYHAHKEDYISATFESRKEENWYRVKASFIETGIANFYKIWSIKKQNRAWILEVRNGVEDEGEGPRVSEEIGIEEEEAKKRLIKEILAEFLDSDYIQYSELEKALRDRFDFKGSLKDKELRCLADDGLCQPSKKPPGLCNSMGCDG